MSDFVSIEDLSVPRQQASLTVKIVRRLETRTVTPRGKEPVQLTTYLIADQTGIMALQAWGLEDADLIDQFVGKTVHVHNAYTSEFNGRLYVSKGRFGEFKASEDDINTVEIPKGYSLDGDVTYTNIKDLTASSQNVNLKVTITKKFKIRNPKENLMVCNCVVADETRDIPMTLWNDDAWNYVEGDIVEIRNGYVSMYKGEIQLNKGKFGTIKKVKA